ncbi:MAG: HAD-IA family hydrolase [Lentisphaeraceae bacterium]|nr:HAD-IA family hydrolase [Lentisphaeraceae bacterium]
MANKVVECVIFDSDGTLVDSEFLGHHCMELKLQELGIKESAEQMKEEFRGWKLNELLKVISRRHGIEDFSEEFILDYRKFLNIKFEESLQAIEGVADALAKLNDRVKICVASSGPMFKIKKAMEVTGLASFFGEYLFSAYDLGVWKPEPDLFLLAANEMGVKPESCIVIEDSEVGVTAGVRAGMKVVHYNPESFEREIKGDIYEIPHMNQLVKTLEGLGLKL